MKAVLLVALVALFLLPAASANVQPGYDIQFFADSFEPGVVITVRIIGPVNTTADATIEYGTSVVGGRNGMMLATPLGPGSPTGYGDLPFTPSADGTYTVYARWGSVEGNRSFEVKNVIGQDDINAVFNYINSVRNGILADMESELGTLRAAIAVVALLSVAALVVAFKKKGTAAGANDYLLRLVEARIEAKTRTGRERDG